VQTRIFEHTDHKQKPVSALGACGPRIEKIKIAKPDRMTKCNNELWDKHAFQNHEPPTGGYSPPARYKTLSGQSIDHTDDLRPHGVDQDKRVAPQTKELIRQFAWTPRLMGSTHPGFPSPSFRRKRTRCIDALPKLRRAFPSSTRRNAVLRFILPLPCPICRQAPQLIGSGFVALASAVSKLFP